MAPRRSKLAGVMSSAGTRTGQVSSMKTISSRMPVESTMPCWMREVSSVNAESSSVNRKLPRMNCLISCRRPMWFHCPVQADWMMPFDPHATHPGPARVLHVGFVTGGLCLPLTLAACGLERDPESGADIASTPHYHVDAQTEVLEGDRRRPYRRPVAAPGARTGRWDTGPGADPRPRPTHRSGVRPPLTTH